MMAVRIVVLRHTPGSASGGGEHYDLMLERPSAGMLATWRVMLPPMHWAAARRMELTRLPDHRRAYVRREGAISGGRGRVWRVDEGWAMVRRWVRDEVVVEVGLRGFTRMLVMRRVGDHNWIATATSAKPQAARP